MSKSVLHILLLSFVLAGALAPASPARAEISMAFVDVQTLLTESKAAKSIQEQLGNQREKFQADVAAMEKKLLESEKKLVELRRQEQEKQQEPSADFLARKTAFEKEVAETRQLVQKRRQALEKAALEAMNELRREILKIVSDTAAEKGYDVVLTKQDVVIADKSLDATAPVMEALNKKLARVELKVETN